MNSKSFYETLINIPLVIMVVGIVVGLFKKAGLGKAQRWILVLLSTSLLAEILAKLVAIANGNNYWVYHLYFPIEFTLVAMVFLGAFSKTQYKLIIKWAIGMIWIYSLLNLPGWLGTGELDTNVSIASNAAIIVLSIALLFQILSEMRYRRIERSSLFWFNMAMLSYCAGSLLLFVFADWLVMVAMDYAVNIWLIHLFLKVLQYLMLIIALWMDPE